MRNPKNAAAVEEVRAEFKAKTSYDAEAAIVEINRLISEACAARPYTAVTGLVQFKLKVRGLLIEKVAHLHREIGPAAALDEARARVTRPPVLVLPMPIGCKTESTALRCEAATDA